MYVTVTNLVRLGIWFPVWYRVDPSITDGHTIPPSIEGQLSPTGIQPAQLQNSVFKEAGLQLHTATIYYTLLVLLLALSLLLLKLLLPQLLYF